MEYNVIKITEATVHFMETEEDDYNHYTRFSADNWTVRMEDCDLEVEHPEHLEKMFQANIEKLK